MTADPPRPSASLAAAAALVAVEAVALLVVAATVAAAASPARLLLDVTTVAFFVLYPLGLLVCAWGLLRSRRWARGPIVLAQLIQLGVAWDFGRESSPVFGGALSSRAVAVVLAAVALGVLVLVLNPAATRALVARDPE